MDLGGIFAVKEGVIDVRGAVVEGGEEEAPDAEADEAPEGDCDGDAADEVPNGEAPGVAVPAADSADVAAAEEVE